MKSPKNAWTKKEDDRLIAIISKNRCKLQKSFEEFHKEFPKRSVSAISWRWYNRLRPNNNTKVCFVNVKKQSRAKQSWLDKLLDFIFNRIK